MDEEQEGWVEDDDEYAEAILPAGFTFAAFLWNVLTLFAEIFTAFARLCYGFRADVATANEEKQAKKYFRSSVEAGIETLG